MLFVLVSLPVLSRVDSESWGNNTGLTGLFSWNVLTISFPWVSVETPELAAVLYSVSGPRVLYRGVRNRRKLEVTKQLQKTRTELKPDSMSVELRMVVEGRLTS